MTTLTLILAGTVIILLIIGGLDRLEQRARRRDRAIIRKLHTYMAKLPPARPW